MIEGYCYKILFSDGCWYWGTREYKGSSPESDGYYGSPVTHKDKWKEPHSKVVVKLFTDREQRLEYETQCILPDLENPKCLNEHASKGFSKESCSKGGRKSAEKTKGVPRTKEVRSKISKSHKGKKLSNDHIKKLKEAKRPPIKPESIAKGVESRKGYRHSEDTKEKIRKGNKGKVRSQEQKNALSEKIRGYSWYNNGKTSIQSRTHPGKGWVEGRLINWDTPRNRGMKWYHRGTEQKMFSEDPGDGWTPGMLPKSTGKSYYNNGFEHVLAFTSPGEGWVPGRLKRS
jgi:hypothetical protein